MNRLAETQAQRVHECARIFAKLRDAFLRWHHERGMELTAGVHDDHHYSSPITSPNDYRHPEKRFDRLVSRTEHLVGQLEMLEKAISSLMDTINKVEDTSDRLVMLSLSSSSNLAILFFAGEISVLLDGKNHHSEDLSVLCEKGAVIAQLAEKFLNKIEAAWKSL